MQLNHKTIIISIMMILLVVSSVSAINTINKVSIMPNESLQGGNIDLCADITSNGNPTVNAIINKPSGQTINIPLFQSNNKCYQNLTGTEYHAVYSDTNQIGNYNGRIESVKGSEYDTKNVTFKTTPISVLIDYVQRVATVDRVLSVDEINQASMDVHGTEYQVNDSGTTFIQLLKNNDPINNATCYVSLYFPNKTLWVDKSMMTYQTGSNALYYFDLNVPNQKGVYMIDAYCNYDTNIYLINSTSYILLNGYVVSGNNESIKYNDNDFLEVSETPISNGNQTLIAYYKFDETNGINMTDSSGYANHGTYNNTPNLTITGTSNTGIYFDGINDFAEAKTNTSLFNLNSSEEIAVCLSYNSLGGNSNGDPLINYKLGGDSGFEVVGSDDEVRFSTDRDGSGNKNHDTLFAFSDSNFHTICFYSGLTEMISYVDGIHDRTTSQAQSGSMTTTSNKLLFGVDDGFTTYIADQLDEVCIIKGTNINISSIATSYNQTKTCNSLLSTSQGEIELEINIDNSTIMNDTIQNNIGTYYKWNNPTTQIRTYIYNYSNNEYVKLTNDLYYTESKLFITSIINGNITNFVNQSKIKILYNATNNDTGMHIFSIDQAVLEQISYIDTPINEVRGGGELHVTTHLLDIPQQVWGYANLTIPQCPEINYTLIQNNQYNYTPRFDSIDEQLQIINFNVSVLPSYTWNYTNRTLTFYPTINVTIIDYPLISEYVWNYSARYTHGVELS